MVQMTFENNDIRDEQGMCNIFKALRGFEKLESLNFRCNKNFNDNIVKALCEGISLKKELRVSQFFYLTIFSFYRLLIWVKMILLIAEYSKLEKH